MSNNKNKVGRPLLTPAEKEIIKQQLLQKIEPFLKSGLSVNKALSEAKIHNSEFYKYMVEDTEFRDKISQFRNFTAVILNNGLLQELFEIIEKQKNKQILTKDDIKFLWKFAKNSKNTKEEWGRKNTNSLDPEAELQKVRAI